MDASASSCWCYGVCFFGFCLPAFALLRDGFALEAKVERSSVGVPKFLQLILEGWERTLICGGHSFGKTR